MKTDGLKTEYLSNVRAEEQRDLRAKQKQEKMTVGDKLNRLSGVEDSSMKIYQPKKQLGRDEFLKLFMTQLRYQDPTSPMDFKDFSNQMAVFSSLEQQVNMNKTLDQIAGQQANMQVAALQLVGKDVVADKSIINHVSSKMSNFSFKLPKDAKDVTVEISNAKGEVLDSLNLGDKTEGSVEAKWEGFTSKGQLVETGQYNFKVKAMGYDGQPVVVSPNIEGRVTGVTSENSQVFLLLGDQKIAFADVTTIREAQNKAAEKNSVPNASVVAPTIDASKLTLAPRENAGQESEQGGTSKEAAVDPLRGLKTLDDRGENRVASNLQEQNSVSEQQRESGEDASEQAMLENPLESSWNSMMPLRSF